jgi:hypothetical protein
MAPSRETVFLELRALEVRVLSRTSMSRRSFLSGTAGGPVRAEQSLVRELVRVGGEATREIIEFTAIRALSLTLLELLWANISNLLDPLLSGVPIGLRPPKELRVVPRPGQPDASSLCLYRVNRISCILEPTQEGSRLDECKERSHA